MYQVPPPGYFQSTRKAAVAGERLTRKALTGTEKLERVALGVTIVAGIFGIATLVSSIGKTTRETRKLFRPEGMTEEETLALLRAMEEEKYATSGGKRR